MQKAFINIGLILAGLFGCLSDAVSQETTVTADNDWALDVETQASFSNDRTPLWLNANKYGISSLNSSNGYVRALGAYDKKFYEDERLDINAGLDVLIPIGYKSQGATDVYTQHLILQQAFAELNYKLGQLTIGAKHQPMELKNNELSTGAQTLGINARPVPQVRIGLNDYWNIPFTRKWLSFKGHIAYGLMTDGGWEETFATGSMNKYNKNVRYHQKAGYLRIGNECVFPLTFTLGLEMGAQFGGTVYGWQGTDQGLQAGSYTFPSNFKSYWHAFTGTGSDNGESTFQNSEGNITGSWVARLNWKAEAWQMGLYWDHYFEDHSGMFFLGNDGYGTGDQWNTMVSKRYFAYSMKDMLLGFDLKLNKARILNQLVIEYMYTKYQSGPVYHDHNKTISEAICGRDNYYNHSSLPGWQHWGQVMGNPLYLSPLYNTDGYIGSECNRFFAWYLGFAGDPIDGLHYRVKLSYQRGWGTYDMPLYNPENSTSFLVEATYTFNKCSHLKNFAITGAIGADFGRLRGENRGGQITIRYKIR